MWLGVHDSLYPTGLILNESQTTIEEAVKKYVGNWRADAFPRLCGSIRFVWRPLDYSKVEKWYGPLPTSFSKKKVGGKIVKFLSQGVCATTAYPSTDDVADDLDDDDINVTKESIVLSQNIDGSLAEFSKATNVLTKIFVLEIVVDTSLMSDKARACLEITNWRKVLEVEEGEPLTVKQVRAQHIRWLTQIKKRQREQYSGMHVWLRLRDPPPQKVWLLSDLFQRFVLTTSSSKQCAEELSHRIRGELLVGDAKILSDHRHQHILLVVLLCDNHDIEFWITHLIELKRDTKLWPEEWLLMAVTPHGDLVTGFLSRLILELDSKPTLTEAFLLSDFVASASPSGTEHQPAKTDIVLSLNVLPDIMLAVYGKRTKDWLVTGKQIPWNIVNESLDTSHVLHGLVVHSELRTRLVSHIMALVRDENRSGLSIRRSWQKFRASGMTTFLRAVAINLKRQLHGNSAGLISNTTPSEMLALMNHINSISIRVVIMIDTSEHSKKQLEFVQKNIQHRPHNLVVVVLAICSWRLYQNAPNCLAPFTHLVSPNEVPVLVDSLKRIYPNSSQGLEILSEQCSLGGSACNIHNFVIAAVQGLTIPVKTWVEQQLEKFGKFKQLLKYSALMTYYTKDSGVVVAVDDELSSGCSLVVTNEVLRDLLAPGHMLLCTGSKSASRAPLWIWNRELANLLLQQSATEGSDSWCLLTNLCKDVKLAFNHTHAKKIVSILLRSVLVCREGHEQPSLFLRSHERQGSCDSGDLAPGKWSDLKSKMLDIFSYVEKWTDEMPHLFVCLSRAVQFYQTATKPEKEEALEIAIQAAEAARNTYFDYAARNNLAHLYVANDMLKDANSLFTKLCESTNIKANQRSMVKRQAHVCLKGTKFENAWPEPSQDSGVIAIDVDDQYFSA